jgi:hypothetical protein
VPRKCIKYNTDSFKKEIPELQNSEVEIYIDTEDGAITKQIAEVLKQGGAKRVKRIIAIILRNEYVDSIYKREDKNVTAIKINAGKAGNQNYRIYCKEVYQNGKKVVMITPHIKKVQKNQQDPKIIKIIERIKTYNYEF